jgi:hypothetical protein
MSDAFGGGDIEKCKYAVNLDLDSGTWFLY